MNNHTSAQEHYYQVGLGNKKHCDAREKTGYPFDDCPECKKSKTQLLDTTPELLQIAQSILRMFERDNIPEHHESRPSGNGVRVHITYRQIEAIRAAIAQAKGE